MFSKLDLRFSFGAKSFNLSVMFPFVSIPLRVVGAYSSSMFSANLFSRTFWLTHKDIFLCRHKMLVNILVSSCIMHRHVGLSSAFSFSTWYLCLLMCVFTENYVASSSIPFFGSFFRAKFLVIALIMINTLVYFI